MMSLIDRHRWLVRRLAEVYGGALTAALLWLIYISIAGQHSQIVSIVGVFAPLWILFDYTFPYFDGILTGGED